MTIAMPNLPFLDGRGVDPATSGQCNSCLENLLAVAGSVYQEEEEFAIVVN
ncbi:hypothetical protein PHYBLDRAFT_145718 [Phycomyces blakesleeanus NRRL 1555(-)]|uniref:Uncharacterized protein n=1 Tax=Phycomyces blakesleeanus (strain ATCC 8743b / DSM 1359 / FGSC 10004 / NBRC 33097 / NRRL 1555) TaxID=763407 RepID=A0A163DTJ7_PHYB8|nr:hypothetical protein PHYBLDRAFT_145718 [Phycomyces blakesleeanus NRRL 1555(-)]OAD73320.1 hypothetical protein PHYBLDRAFT_145718 [Phycomyces blakesleeanus NRRL 1555(-)]|eukprot:XP_018291360.1 hypothetical protein PHYBLDRAFT_145718 [Phycomyces blakesleeanus NRRL 1555(-)]